MKLTNILAAARGYLFRPERDTVQLIDGGPNAPQLAMRPKDYSVGAITPQGKWKAQVKLDGIRCLYIDGRLVTLEGQPLNAARHCLAALRDLESAYDQPMFFDAEYVEEDGFEATLAAYRKGEGTGTVWVFDAVPMAEWRDDVATQTFDQRNAALMAAHAGLRDVHQAWVGTLAAFDVPDHATLEHLFGKVMALHHEGLVLKRGHSLYRRSYSDEWLRLKETCTTDFKLIDIQGNDTQGARRLVCRGPRGPVILTKGFSAERQMIWANRDLFLGNEDVPAVMVEVKHNGLTARGQPRHAVFSKLRQDKLPPLEPAGGVL